MAAIDIATRAQASRLTRTMVVCAFDLFFFICAIGKAGPGVSILDTAPHLYVGWRVARLKAEG
jgi:hypothetical protein